ncbi:hypothetical protein MYCTH_2306365 [Thermothelomyces thermophilus ATCC 42464]|uniref:Uncharacterized protein n=1 Tax=Thermothelomyces thermophilus (strain ATCC 42464 / BCRC 31852 / DSM 1799) TaxID=573729 RepID=G2QHC5_THET4|nr:uncharacterized protein MYCTH_2306365 [Thermothelomyces thermophilus ATCC 42464]AEO58785.1 hypothetical protein MYCTH_2306365 [Thermothelomyces thermophilus ATCC 42464]
MAWVTYEGILKANGGSFQSKGTRRPFYDFPLALRVFPYLPSSLLDSRCALRGTPFLDDLREDRMQYFQVELPKIREPLIAKASDIWEKDFAEIRSLIGDAAPDILPFFELHQKSSPTKHQHRALREHILVSQVVIRGRLANSSLIHRLAPYRPGPHGGCLPAACGRPPREAAVARPMGRSVAPGSRSACCSKARRRALTTAPATTLR